MTNRVTVDTSLCMGSGNCVELAPAYFGQSEETGMVELITPEVDPADRADVERAALICPAGVIRLESSV